MFKRRGFTLVEFSYLIVIVVVLAAISIPVYRKLAVRDCDAAAKESLLLIRDAICIYASEHDGRLPGADGSATTFKREIAEQLQNPFPRCPVGSGAKRGVEMVADDADLCGETRPKNAWKYNYQTGEFTINSREHLVGDPGMTYDEL